MSLRLALYKIPLLSQPIFCVGGDLTWNDHTLKTEIIGALSLKKQIN